MLKIFLFFIFALNATAYVPLYEIGLFTGRATVPDYPGSDETTNHTIVFPSFIYRGFIFRSDDKGNRLRFFTSEKVDIDVSFGASFPASANENKARDGMDDLDWLGEFGPRVSYMLIKKPTYEFELELPLRFVFSTDFEFTRHRGYRFQPQLDFRWQFYQGFQMGLSSKLNYATEQFADYFYQVDIGDVSVNREQYNAKGGYIGQDLSMSLIYRYQRFLSILGLRQSQYHRVANEDSPLFKTRQNSSLFIAFNYFFYKSSAVAPENIYTRTPTQ